MIKQDDIIIALMHKIDRKKDYAEMASIETGDVKNYISSLMIDILENKNYKHYKVKSMTKEVIRIVSKSIEDEKIDEKNISNIANRYLDAEKKGQEHREKMKGQIKEGFLIEALLKTQESYYYFISKVEINDYLNAEELVRQGGMPYGDKALKTCLFKFTVEKELEDIYVSDKQNAVYWYSQFLELEECSSNEKATKELYAMIERKIRNNTRKSTTDYYSLRNALVTYFQNPKRFTYEGMMDIVFEGYEPIEPSKVDIDKIKKEVYEEIKSKKYDTEFWIDPNSIKTRLKKNIRVNSFVNLQLDGGDENYATMISAFEEKGKKYLKIESDEEAYLIFCKK